MNNIRVSKNRAFTLVEALIAVTILTFAVVGPLSTASRALVASQIARDQLTATYLAQEGVEYVRAMRDDAYLNAYKSGIANTSQAAWTDFTTGGSNWSITNCKTTMCMVDTYPSVLMGTGGGLSLQPCGGSSPACKPLYMANGMYTEQGGSGIATQFTRTIQATDNAAASNENIVSTVSWSFHGTPYSVVVTDRLTPWQ